MDQNLVGSGMVPEPSRAAKANEKVEGKSDSSYNEDGLRRTYEVNTFLTLTTDDKAEGDERPYLVYLDETSGKVMGVVRNWQQEDKLHERMHWMIEWGFIPWRGAYPIGLTHLIGGLAAAATGALRALLDSAHIQNFPGSLKLKGAGLTGSTQQVQPTQMVEVTGGVGADDIRKLVMPFPNNGPSATLYQLLGFLVESGESVVQTAFEKLQDNNNPNMPVGTVMSMIEQGLTVMNGIHARQHVAMARTLQVLHRIIAMYVTDQEIFDDTGELIAYAEDFKGPVDVVPVSDPAIFSEAQRFAQMQAVAQRAAVNPDLYDKRKVEVMILNRMHIQDVDSLLVPQQQVHEMNAVNENLAMTLGRPVAAFPDQDHLAHIQVLLDFMTSDFLGFSPIIAPTYLPSALEHLKEHIVFYYVSHIHDISSQAAGKDMAEFLKIRDPGVRAESDKLLAQASQAMRKDQVLEQSFKSLPAIIQRAISVLQQYAPKPQQDPMVAIEMQKVQQRSQESQQNAQATSARIQGDREKTLMDIKDRNQQRLVDMQKHRETIQADLQQNQQDNQVGLEQNRETQQANVGRAVLGSKTTLQQVQVQQASEDQRTAAKVASDERQNMEDNQTALTIAEAEIGAGEKTAISDGHGLGR